MTHPQVRSNLPTGPVPAGRGRCASRNADGLDALMADPHIGSTAKAIAVALVRNWAWYKDHCWPSDRSIAARVGRSVGHVQRCLRRLEAAGWVVREKTGDVPTGRRIWLAWRRPDDGQGARPVSTPARTSPAAPARDKRIVVVNNERELERGDSTLRRRQLSSPPPAAPPPAPASGTGAPSPEHPACARAGHGPAVAVGETLRRLVSRAREAHAVERSAGRKVEAPRAGVKSPVRKGGFTLEELVAVVKTTADPILAAELARRTAPPAPAAPEPSTLATPELLAALPGRHDLAAAATRRLCEETGDHRTATWSFFRKAVLAVVERGVGPDVLAGCLRQATGPRTRHRGKVFVSAWKREGVAPG